MFSLFRKKTAADVAGKNIMASLKENLNGSVDGLVLGFAVDEDNGQMHVIFGTHGHHEVMGVLLAEALGSLMQKKEMGVVVTAAIASALNKHRPELMKDPIDVLLESINQHDCGDPDCQAHQHARAKTKAH